MSAPLPERLRAPVDFLRRRLPSGLSPDIAIVLGSGWAPLADRVRSASTVEFGEVPGFPEATVSGHRGRLVFGRWGPREVVVMQGRVHLYEGYSARQVVFPLEAVLGLGVRTVLVTNAAGGVNPRLQPGDLMLMSDHLNLTGQNPLVGPQEPGYGVRFPDMTDAYDPSLRALVHRVEGGSSLPEGVYAGLLGPNYETPAEVRMLARLGADAVGMSTVHEVLAARHQGARVLGLSCISNPAAGVGAGPLHHADVTAVVAAACGRAERLLSGFLDALPDA